VVSGIIFNYPYLKIYLGTDFNSKGETGVSRDGSAHVQLEYHHHGCIPKSRGTIFLAPSEHHQNSEAEKQDGRSDLLKK
jgi:hypothetical protein